MKKRKTKININMFDLIKETPEERLERVRREGARFRPRVVEDKTKYNRKKLKGEEKWV